MEYLGDGEKGENQADQHRLQKAGECMQRTETHRREDRGETHRTTSPSNKETQGSGTQNPMRSRNCNLGPVGAADPQTPHHS